MTAPTPKQREEREETVEHLARALRMADCVRLREATGNRHPTWDELREDQRQGYRVEAAHRMANLDSPRKREPKILRLEGTYSGVRFGNAAIPEDITAEEVFERLRTHSPEEPSTPVHDGHCTTCGAPAEIVEGEEGTVSVVRSEEPVGEVHTFASLMQGQLDDNAHKPGWKDDSWQALLTRLLEETEELEQACGEYDRKMIRVNAQAVAREAADVANFAMMIADVCEGLAIGQPLDGEGSNG